jgi:hypothetical protein
MSVFIRSNSGEPGFDAPGTSSARQSEEASNSRLQVWIILFFICLFDFDDLFHLQLYDERTARLRTPR